MPVAEGHCEVPRGARPALPPALQDGRTNGQTDPALQVTKGGGRPDLHETLAKKKV